MARPPKDSQIRITEILDTAEHLFTINGYCGTTINDIAKEMSVAQGMPYYYFKSKEEILEALVNRHISSIIAEIKAVTCSDSMTPLRKIELTLFILLRSVRYKDGLLFYTLRNEQHLHMKERVAHLAKSLFTPLLLTVIEEGIRTQSFHVSHLKTTLAFILIIIEPLYDALYEKMSAELLSHRLRMAEALIEKALGLQEAMIHISL